MQASLENGELEHAQQSKGISMERARRCKEALPSDIEARDDSIEAQLGRENSSGKSKLVKVYQLLADFSDASEPFVACSKGCSACCKMNVDITSIEAERLSAASGKRMASVRAPLRRSTDEFSGVPCPFLVGDVCSVYEARPYACRAHQSFDTDAFWCQPERSNSVELTRLRLDGARSAYSAIAGNTQLHGFADIRDFFPESANRE